MLGVALLGLGAEVMGDFAGSAAVIVAITSGLNVLSAHVVLDPGTDAPQVLDHLVNVP